MLVALEAPTHRIDMGLEVMVPRTKQIKWVNDRVMDHAEANNTTSSNQVQAKAVKLQFKTQLAL